MNIRLFPAVLILALLPSAHAAKPVSDIQPPDVRRALVERVGRLAQQGKFEAVSQDLPSPFNPAGFGTGAASDARDGRAPAGKAATAAPVADRELLAAVAGKIPTTGTMIMGGKPLLISGRNRIESGSHFTVVYNGQEYELELIAIDRTTFTVRYKGEEFTRPIKLGKTP